MKYRTFKLKHSCKWQSMTSLWSQKHVKLRDGVFAIETSSLWLVWMKYESYILHAESLRLERKKHESCILHTSAVMYTFQNLNIAVNDKVWPDLDLGRRSNWEMGVRYWTSYPKVGMGQLLKWYLEIFSSYIYFSKLIRRTWTWV